MRVASGRSVVVTPCSRNTYLPLFPISWALRLSLRVHMLKVAVLDIAVAGVPVVSTSVNLKVWTRVRSCEPPMSEGAVRL